MRAYQNRLISNNDKALKSWRHDVATAALQHRPDDWNIKDPVELHCEFVFPRPLGHFGTGKNSDKLKASAPTHHTKTPDADKLTRGIGDAISVTKVLLHDDSQIVRSTPTSVTPISTSPHTPQITVIPRSMNCPHCGSSNITVAETRPSDENTRSRRRKCKDCGEWFPTLEVVMPTKGLGCYYEGPNDAQHYRIRTTFIKRISSFVANSLVA